MKVDAAELKKPANVACRHATGHGCGVYEVRPDICRVWFCLWRRIGELPDELRPDRSGLLAWFQSSDPAPSPFEREYIVIRGVEDDDEALHSGPARALLDMLVREGSHPVFFGRRGYKFLVYPDPDIVRVVLDPDATPHRDLVPDVLRWRRRLGLPDAHG